MSRFALKCFSKPTAPPSYSLDSTLRAPVMSLAFAGNLYPPQFNALFPEGFYTGYKIEFWSSSTFAGLQTALASAGALLDDDDDNGTVNASLSGISSGKTFAACRLVDPSNLVYGPTSNYCVHGDVTAPTLSTSSPTSANEKQPTLATLTFNELVNMPTLSGTDASLLAISGASPATSYSVILASGLDLNYETKTSYSYTIDATDLAGNTLASAAMVSNVVDLDEQPAAISFTPETAASLSTVYTASGSGAISGLGGGVSAPYSVSGGLVSKNGGAFSSASGTFVNGDTFQLRGTASSSYSTAVNVTLTYGEPNLTASFTITTIADPAASGMTVGTVVDLSVGSTTATFNNVPFIAGRPAIAFIVTDNRNVTGVTINGAACTLSGKSTNGDLGFAVSPNTVSAGNYTVVVTTAVTMTSASIFPFQLTTVGSATPNSEAHLDIGFRSAGAQSLSGSVTVPTNGIMPIFAGASSNIVTSFTNGTILSTQAALAAPFLTLGYSRTTGTPQFNTSSGNFNFGSAASYGP